MKTLLPSIAAVAALATAFWPASATSAPQGVAEVGDTIDYSFRTPPVNALGIKSFDELRGKPVLVEFWGTY